MSRHPLVKWAQRSDQLFITVELPDAKNVMLNLEPEGKFSFSATSGTDSTQYAINMDLFDRVDVNESKARFTSRNICYLVKKAENKWWSRLLKQEGKPPVFLKVDWDKWVDEDERDVAMDDGDFDFSKFNMGGAGDSDEEDDESDTDEENKEEVGTASEENKEEMGTANGGTEPAPVSNEPTAAKA